MGTSIDDMSARMATIAGAYAGVSALFVSVILGQQSAVKDQPTIDFPLAFGLCCFSAAIPLAILAYALSYKALHSSAFVVSFWTSSCGTAIGIAATLWHINAYACLSFCTALAVATFLFVRIVMRSND